MKNPSYGIAEVCTVSDRVDMHVQEIRLTGFTIVEGAVEAGAVQQWRELIDAVIAEEEIAGGGPAEMSRLGEANTARAPLHRRPRFVELANDPIITAICSRLLDGYFILNQQNAVVNPPSGQAYHQSAYHRDLPYQHFVSSRPIAISALYCADDFTDENGATLLLPGSHKLEAFPGDTLVDRCERSIIAQAGSYLVFDSMLFHRGGENRSPRPRRAVNHVYSRAFVKQQIALPRLLGNGFSADPAIRRLLGFDCDPPDGVDQWLASRRSRIS